MGKKKKKKEKKRKYVYKLGNFGGGRHDYSLIGRIFWEEGAEEWAACREI